MDKTGAFDFPERISAGRVIGKAGPVELPSAEYEFISYTEELSARENLLEGKLSLYFVIPAGYMETGEIRTYSMERGFQEPMNLIEGVLIENLLKEKVGEETLERVKHPARMKSFTLNREGEIAEKSIFSFLAPFAFAFILVMSIFISSNFLLQGIVEEKEGRIIEVLLSSISSEGLMIGKIFGLGAVGLTQLSVWMVAGIFPASFMLTALSPSLQTVVVSFVYFILGFLLYASMMAGIGGISTSLKEGQQLAAVFSMMAAVPLIFIQAMIGNPEELLAKVLFYFPFTSPVAAMGRGATMEVPVGEILLSIGVLAISTALAIKISARLFRLGVLMYGKRPSLREIARYFRAG